MMRMCVQEFMSDQAATLAKVADYCSATNLSRAVDPYVYSYDQTRQFLYCRNHKVRHPPVKQSYYHVNPAGCLLHHDGNIQDSPLRSSKRRVRLETFRQF